MYNSQIRALHNHRAWNGPNLHQRVKYLPCVDAVLFVQLCFGRCDFAFSFPVLVVVIVVWLPVNSSFVVTVLLSCVNVAAKVAHQLEEVAF